MSSKNLFKISACLPAERRTPWASNIVTKAKTKAKANRGEEKPSSRPLDKAKAVAPAACEEGIPPVPINQRKLNRFSLITPKVTLTVWVKTQATIVMERIRFCIKKRVSASFIGQTPP